MISASIVDGAGSSSDSAIAAASLRPRSVPDRYEAIIERTSSGGRGWSLPLAAVDGSAPSGRCWEGTVGTTVDGYGGETGTGEIGAGDRGLAGSLCRNGSPDGVSVVGSPRRTASPAGFGSTSASPTPAARPSAPA